MSLNKKEICLWDLEQLALIISCSSGIEYQNQVGGNSCLQNSTEGILVFICDDLKYIINELSPYMLNKVRLTSDEADYVDNILFRNGAGFLSVDRSKLNECVEAWLYVDIIEESKRQEYYEKMNTAFDNNEIKYKPTIPFCGFSETKGVLTWCNSD